MAEISPEKNMSTPPSLIEIQNLSVCIRNNKQALYPLQGVSFSIGRNLQMALVGESGSGKSLTAAAILGMLPPGSQVTRGKIIMGGRDLISLPEKTLQKIRGKEISIVFQNPGASLNPVRTVGTQIAEVIRVHEQLSGQESREKAIEMLESLGIPDPRKRSKDYPHQYSGGMAQRAALAMAMACRPDLLIADEPTSGLDATLQQQVLELLTRQVQNQRSSLLLITHDISVVGSTCEQVAVMYGGRIMEFGPTELVLRDPAHPYTEKLIDSFNRSVDGRMTTIPGSVRPPISEATGCPFAERCHRADDECHIQLPELQHKAGRMVACVKV